MVTMSRRGIELVIENMLLNTETSTMIGMAFTAAASGLNSSFDGSEAGGGERGDQTRAPVPEDEPDERVGARCARRLHDERTVHDDLGRQIAEGFGSRNGLMCAPPQRAPRHEERDAEDKRSDDQQHRRCVLIVPRLCGR